MSHAITIENIAETIKERRTYDYCFRMCKNSCVVRGLIHKLIYRMSDRYVTETVYALAEEGKVHSFDEWMMILEDAKEDGMNIACMEVTGKQCWF